MKGVDISDVLVTPVPHTGFVTLKRESVELLRGCKVVQHGGAYRLHAFENYLALTLSPDDASFIINKFTMVPRLSEMIRRVVIWEDV